MTSVALPVHSTFFSRERTVAGQSFNRWLVPPAALAIHLCIGMAYGFSVFWLPLSRAVGISAPKVCAEDMGFFAALVQTGCDWKISSLGWTFTLFFLFPLTFTYVSSNRPLEPTGRLRARNC